MVSRGNSLQKKGEARREQVSSVRTSYPYFLLSSSSESSDFLNDDDNDELFVSLLLKYYPSRVKYTRYPLPTYGIDEAITVMFKMLASRGNAAIAWTVFAASTTEKTGSGIIVPFA
jgi:hypothetical protein